MAHPDESIELRMQTPRLVVDILDAVSQARRISRTELANRVLDKWARAVLHEMSVVERVTKGNPPLPAPSWNDTET